MSRLIEVVGPPGAGKSTLLSELERGGDVEVVDSARAASVHRFRAATTFAGGRSLLGASVAWRRPPRTRQIARWCVRLGAFEPLLAPAAQRAEITVIDQGPVYTLARLAGCSSARRGTSWWTTQVTTWARLLDTVIVLDADDDVLRERIGARAKAHSLRDASAERAIAEIRMQRLDLERTVFHLRSFGLPVTRLTTDLSTPSELSHQLAQILHPAGTAIDPTTTTRSEP